MSSEQSFVIVGASLAGAKAAETLRIEGFDGCAGTSPQRKLRPCRGLYADNDIELLTGTRVASIDPRRARGDTAGRQPYAVQPAPPVHGRCPAAPSTAGCGPAASARQLGAEVAIVAPEPVPLERVLGPEIGSVYRDLHAAHGVDLHLSTQTEAIVGTVAAQGVRTKDGSFIEGGLIVVGVGVSPRDELARDTGLTLENGIVADEFLRTSAPDIFAAGDVAATWNPMYQKRIRMEH